MVFVGSSEVSGSWKIIAMSLPRISRRSLAGRPTSSLPSSLIEPPTMAPPGGSRPMIDRPVIDFPQPDSPTSPSVSPGSMVRLMPPTAWTTDLASWMCVERSLICRTGTIRRLSSVSSWLLDPRCDGCADLDGAAHRAEPVMRLLHHVRQHRPGIIAAFAAGKSDPECDLDVGQAVAAGVARLVRVDLHLERVGFSAAGRQDVDVDRCASADRGQQQFGRGEVAAAGAHGDLAAAAVGRGEHAVRDALDGHGEVHGASRHTDTLPGTGRSPLAGPAAGGSPGAERIDDLPRVAEGFLDPAQQPAMLLAYRIDPGGTGRHGPRHHGLRILDDQQDPRGGTAPCLTTAVALPRPF